MSTQKHSLLFVPNYDQSNTSGAGTFCAPLTYLRLGSVINPTEALTTEKERGDDLLRLAGIEVGTDDFFEDDHRCGQDGTGSVHADGDAIDGGTSIADAGTTYYRYDGLQHGSDYKEAKDRKGLTKQLMGDGDTITARGGWRDHTDGNRLVTVRGDRVDVVMGNYKRVIFGRIDKSGCYGDAPDSPLRKSYWEVSGGHIFQGTSTGLCQLQSIEWVKESIDGQERWKVTEKTVKGDSVVRYSGRVEEHYNGPWIQTVIGKDSGDSEANPEIIVDNYVKKHESSTAAFTISEETTVDVEEETTTGPGADYESTTISLVNIETMGLGTPVSEFKDDLWTKEQLNVDITLASIGIEAGGEWYHSTSNAISLRAAGNDLSLSIGGTSTEMYLGEKIGVRIGPSLEVNIGVINTISILQSWNIGQTLGIRLVETDTEVCGVKATVGKTDLSALKKKLGLRIKT